MTKNNKREYIVSSNCLYKLKEIIDNFLDLLNIRYEILNDGDVLSYVDLKTKNKFIVSDKSEFRKYDLRGIKGDNTIIQSELNWKPKLNLNQICDRMITYELRKNR